MATTGEGVLTATVGIGHGNDTLDVDAGGLGWFCIDGDATGVDCPWLADGDGFVFEGFADVGDVVSAGTGGLAVSPSVSRRRFTPRELTARVLLSFRPSWVALMRI